MNEYFGSFGSQSRKCRHHCQVIAWSRAAFSDVIADDGHMVCKYYFAVMWVSLDVCSTVRLQFSHQTGGGILAYLLTAVDGVRGLAVAGCSVWTDCATGFMFFDGGQVSTVCPSGLTRASRASPPRCSPSTSSTLFSRHFRSRSRRRRRSPASDETGCGTSPARPQRWFPDVGNMDTPWHPQFWINPPS